jgi:hypothetical protein
MGGSESGTPSGFHLTVPVFFLPVPPVRTLKCMNRVSFHLFHDDYITIQYNTTQYTAIRKATKFFNRSHSPSASPQRKGRYHSTADTVVNTFQCKTNYLIVHTLPRSNDQISFRTDDITHDIRTRVCNIPPPSLFSLGKDKKVVLSMNLKKSCCP